MYFVVRAFVTVVTVVTLCFVVCAFVTVTLCFVVCAFATVTTTCPLMCDMNVRTMLLTLALLFRTSELLVAVVAASPLTWVCYDVISEHKYKRNKNNSSTISLSHSFFLSFFLYRI